LKHKNEREKKGNWIWSDICIRFGYEHKKMWPDFQFLPTQNVYSETVWGKLEHRRTRRKLQ